MQWSGAKRQWQRRTTRMLDVAGLSTLTGIQKAGQRREGQRRGCFSRNTDVNDRQAEIRYIHTPIEKNGWLGRR